MSSPLLPEPSFNLRRRLPAALRPLAELAFDLAWTGRAEVRALFADLDPEVWEAGPGNPAIMLELADGARLAELAADPGFLARLEAVVADRSRAQAARPWLERTHPGAGWLQVAYFSAEVGIAESLPFYAGGLGVLAGDLLKAAGGLGMQFVGVSLLYGRGFFRQRIDPEGWQREHHPCTPTDGLPVGKRLRPDGSALVVGVPLPGRRLDLQVWEARVGSATLLLLDANLPQNGPADREVTCELYPDDREGRLLQEMVLGIGGWRALEAAGYTPAVLHLNEGHCALAAVERTGSLARRTHCGYAAARTATAASNLFTTHTPVAAAFDAFDAGLARRLLGSYAGQLGLAVEDLLDLGRMHPGDRAEPFGMMPLAVRHAGALNGVSRLHGGVSRHLFRPLFPRIPDVEVPVEAVTNGIDTASWMGAPMAAVWRRAGWMGDRELTDGSRLVAGLAAVGDDEIAAARAAQRRDLVTYVRRRARRSLGAAGRLPRGGAAAAGPEDMLDADVLTLGFARRFTAYKRPTLLFRDPGRLRRLLLDPARPVQLVMAGKAHPGDDDGKRMIQTVVRFAADPAVGRRMAFLEDDDLDVTAHLVAGVDVWLNAPVRPLEACGTSGMKVLANGGLNCSVRDGWWDEAYTPQVGWSFGDEDPPDDARDADELFRCLEEEVVPAFYAGDGSWMARVRASMSLAPHFDAGRTLRDYVERHYLTAAQRHARLTAGDGQAARDLAAWAEGLRRHWSEIGFGSRREAAGRLEGEVHLGRIPLDAVRIEAYADNPASAVAAEAAPGPEPGLWRTAAAIPAGRRPGEYTLRVIPHHPDAPWPAVLPLIAWER